MRALQKAFVPSSQVRFLPSDMQIHYAIQQQCELKANGFSSFVRAMATFALVRDLELGEPAWSQADTPRLRAALQLDDPNLMLEGLSVRLPMGARRAKDADGWIEAPDMLQRARKIAERGGVCQDCAACATTPDRFGCWGTITLPLDDPSLAWLLQIWRGGVTTSGKVRLRHWLDQAAAQPVGLRLASEVLGFDNPGDPRLQANVAVPGAGFETLDAGLFIRALCSVRRLDLRAMTELLADLRGVSWTQARALGKHAIERHKARTGGAKPSSDLALPVIPFLHQPDEGDVRGIGELKAFLYACYTALHLGLEIELATVSAEEPLSA